MPRSIYRKPSAKHEKDKELDIIRKDHAKKAPKEKKTKIHATIKAIKTLRGVRK